MSMPPIPVEPLEEKLRGLGYLNNPLDAFVARQGQKRRSSLLSQIAVVGARSAAVVGPLLGLLTTAENAVLLPGLLAKPRDLLIFGLYQVGLFTLLFFVLGLIWGGAIALVFKLRSRPVGRPVLLRSVFEIVGGLAIFFYLSYWWNSRAAALGAEALWPGIVAVSVFAALSLVVGRFLGLSGYLVVMQLRPETPVPQLPRHSMGFVLASGGGCVALFSLSLGLSGGGAPPDAVPGTALRVPPALRESRVLLVGMDGLSVSLLKGSTVDGRFETLSRLWEKGAVAALDLGRRAVVPPVTWTTVTTGIQRRQHGVGDFDTRLLYGIRQPLGSRGPSLDLFEALQNLIPAVRVVERLPLSSAQRHSKALWEIFSGAGIPSAGLNWWASWPTGDGPEIVVSDRAFTRLSLAKGEDGSAPGSEGETWPPELLSRLAPLASSNSAVLDPVLRQLEATFGSKPLKAIEMAYRSDRFIQEAATWLWQESKPSFLAVYFRQLDIALRAIDPLTAPPLAKAAALGKVSDLALGELDRFLSRSRELMGPDLTIVLVGIPSTVEIENYPGLLGVFALAGPAIRAPHKVERGRPMALADIAPTLIPLYGLPLSRELAGKPALELIRADFLARYPVRTVPGYGARQPPKLDAWRSTYDAQQIELMRSLGYIE